MTERVYLHVGLPKTGTTYLQRSLWRSRAPLAEVGVLLPGPNRRFQRLAAWDLIGRRLRGVKQVEVAGTWQQLVQLARDWSGSRVVVSEEFLVHCRPRHIRRVVADLAPAEVHVVVTVRDLGRVIGSAWQQEVVKSRTWGLPEFLAAVRDPDQGPPTAGVAFWLRYDVRRVLEDWASVIPPERIHLVLVPPPGAAPEELLERFAAVLDVPADRFLPAKPESNASLGLAGTELLRRVNLSLQGAPNERQYRYIVDKLVKPALRHERGNGTQVVLPPSELEWVSAWTDELITYLAASDYDVVGDLEDLRSPVRGAGAASAGPASKEAPVSAPPTEVTDAELLDAAVQTLAAVLNRQARTWWRAEKRAPRREADPVARIASARRAAVYRAKVGALERADSNRLLAFLAHRYTRRAVRSRPPGKR